MSSPKGGKPKGKKDAGLFIRVHPNFIKLLNKIDADVPVKIDNPQKTKLITEKFIDNNLNVRLTLDDTIKKRGRTKGENEFAV